MDLNAYKQFSFLGGENRKVSDFLIAPNQARESLNCTTTKAGAGYKRRGHAKYNTDTFGTGAIYGHYRFYKEGAPVCALSKCGTGLYKDDNDTPIYNTLTASKWMSFIANNDICFMSDTVKALKYDGANVNKWGITAPITKPTTVEGSGTGLTGDYYYKVTFITEVSESSGSPVSTKLTITDKDIDLSDILVCSEADVTCTGRKLYRMGGTTATYNLVATLNTTDVTYTDSMLDGDVGAELGEYHDPPHVHAHNIVYKGRVLYVKENSSRLYLSQLDEPEYFAGDLPLEGFIDVPGQDIVTGFALQFGYLLIFKTNSTWRLFGDSPVNFQIDNVHPTIGSIAPRSIVNEANDVYFYRGQGEYYAFEGQRIKLISEKEEPLFLAIPVTYQKNVCAGFYKNQLIVSFTSSNGTYNDRTLMYDPRYPDKTKVGPWYYWEGLNISCFRVWNGEGDDGVLRTGSSKEGYIHKQDTGYNDDGEDIEWSWTHIFGLYPELDKRFRKLYVNCLVKSDLNISWVVDRGLSAKTGSKIISPTVDANSSKFRVAKFRVAKFFRALRTTIKLNLPQKGLGKMIRVKFREKSKQELEFYGFILWFRRKR